MHFLVLFALAFLFQCVEPKNVELSPWLSLKWDIDQTAKTITCALTFDSSKLPDSSNDTANVGAGNGWFGFGWHQLGDMDGGMPGSDMIVSLFDSQRPGLVQDHICPQIGTPPTDLTMGGTDDVLSFDIKVDGTMAYSTFTRKLDTGDPFDFPLLPGPMKIVFAGGVGVYAFHGKHCGTAVLDFFDDYCGNAKSCKECLASPPDSPCVVCKVDGLCYNKGFSGDCPTFNTTCQNSPKNPIFQMDRNLIDHSGGVSPRECPSGLTPLQNAWTPPGFCPTIWATGLAGPRGLISASNGDLLVVEAVVGRVTVLWDDNKDGRSDSTERAVLATATRLNHGVQINQEHLYASNPTTVFRWRYTAGQRSNLGAPETVLVNIPSGGHNTRAFAFDRAGFLYVAVGSASNVDSDTLHARIHKFDLSSGLPVDWNDGELFAEGMRNTVGITFDDQDRLWGVENGCDNLVRNDLGGDIHTNNPSEEVNLFAESGKFYGYPYCWSEYILPNFGKGPGTQWVHPNFMGQGYTDAWCSDTANVVRPVWNMAAHQAPLDIHFYHGNSFPQEFVGSAMVSLHGSWNRQPAQGYRVNYLIFNNGLPVREEVLLRHNGQNENWPSNFRPVALTNAECRDGANDDRDCVFVSSDANGQIVKLGYYN